MTNPLGTTRPAQLHNSQNPPRPPGPKHDNLHMMPGLTCCWCICQKCFLRYADGNGICICRECPCAGSYEATKAMYVPYRHTENPHG